MLYYAREASPVSVTRIFKPVIILTLAAVVFSAAGSGQTRPHDLSLHFGVLSSDQVIDIFGDPALIVIPLGSFHKEDMKSSGVPFLTYHYSANTRFGFGGALGCYSVSGALAEPGGGIIFGEFREKNTIGAVELDYHWIMRPGLQLYSGAGFGVKVRRGTYMDGLDADTETKVLPAFHLNAVGLRLGRKVAFFAELGIGYKGLLAVGLNGQF
jgi:hypothetical protein